MKLSIAYFYPEELNLYGDNGNVEIIEYRAQKRGIVTEIIRIDSTTQITKEMASRINLVFMGGGPDSGQKSMYRDLLDSKSAFLRDYIADNGVALFICGAYQLMGHYYKSADGSELPGLGIFDMYTQHFGIGKNRCVGNTSAKLSSTITQDRTFINVNKIGENIVGFENHGGQTFLGKSITPLASMVFGNGNNSVDTTEGIHYKNALGTYFHGPFLSKNAHIADYLIAKSIRISELLPLDDTIIMKAHAALLQKYK